MDENLATSVMNSLEHNSSVPDHEALLEAVEQRRGSRGLVPALDAALERGDKAEAAVLMLAGLATADVCRWVAARIAPFLAAGMADGWIRQRMMSELAASDIPKSEMIGHAEAIIENAGSAEEVRDFLRVLHEMAGLARFGWRLVKDLVHEGELEAALAVLDQMEEQGHELAVISQFHADLLSLYGRHDEAICISRNLMSREPDRADHKRNLLRHLMAADRTEELEKELPRVLADHPSDWMLMFFLHRARISPETLAECFKILVPPDSTSDPRGRLHYAAAALAVGDLKAAEEALDFEIPEAISYAASFRCALDHVVETGLEPSGRFVSDATRPFQVVRAGHGKPTVVVCFGNTGINFSFLGLGFVDSLLEQFDVNVIYLRETRKMLFHQGIEGLGETEAETIAAIEQLHEELGSSQRIYLGGSLGGYGAARYGHLSCADAVLSFAGPTDLFGFADRAIPKAIHVAQYILLQKVGKSLKQEDGELSRLIRNTDTRHFQFYGENDPTDTEQAIHIADLPNVTLLPVPDAGDHFVFGYCVANGMFQRVLTDVLGKEERCQHGADVTDEYPG